MSKKKVSVTFNEFKLEKSTFAELNEEGNYEVSLGFLSYQHIYIANFKVSHKLGHDLIYDNGNCKYISLISINYLESESSDELQNFVHEIYVNVRVEIEPWIEEHFTFKSLNGDDSLNVILKCKILTMAMGYPNLKLNVRCIDKFSEESV